MTNVHIVKRFLGDVRLEDPGRATHEPVVIVFRVLRNEGRLNVGDEVTHPVEFAVDERQVRSVVTVDRRVLQAVNVRQRLAIIAHLPEVGIAADGERLLVEVADFGERTAGNRVVVGEGHRVGDIFPDVLWHNANATDQNVGQRINLVQIELDVQIINLLDTGDIRSDAIAVQRREFPSAG